MSEPATSKKKQALIDAKKASPFEIGEEISVLEGDLKEWTNKKERPVTVQIVGIDGPVLSVLRSGTGYQPQPIDTTKVKVSRFIMDLGANPFDKPDPIRAVAFDMESILAGCGLSGRRSYMAEMHDKETGFKAEELNWNPFVHSHGSKVYYQRPFVWEIEDKQLLIQSIYQGIDCGKLIFRKRSWKWLEEQHKAGETELAFKDIVDGKQRLKAVWDFTQGLFPDMEGNYWGDLSFRAQIMFKGNQLFSYAEMGEDATDAEVIRQFLKLNFTGVQMSKEHIEFVKSISL